MNLVQRHAPAIPLLWRQNNFDYSIFRFLNNGNVDYCLLFTQKNTVALRYSL